MNPAWLSISMVLLQAPPAEMPATPPPSPDELIRVALPQLIKMQEEGGQWPYEGVYRVHEEIPVGYRVGGTAIVAGTLLVAADPNDASASAAIDRGLEFVLSRAGLGHDDMVPSTRDAYDVRVWGHAYALEFLCRVRAAKRAGKHAAEVDSWIPKLVKSLETEELANGGWNYATRREPASFVTAPVVQALLVARGSGEKTSDTILRRARTVLEGERLDSGAFLYSGILTPQKGDAKRPDVRAQLPGSIARSPICETTLRLLGGGSVESIQASIDAFHEHWSEIEKRRRKSGTHEGPYGIAPYYCYYGHRYAAQAIEMLPKEKREKERARFLEVVMRTRDDDGTWNDRVFPRSRNFGTSMIVLALLGERMPLPPPF
ncbi:MAG: hypothetical protein HYR85_23345 [Planctomycetes bacterium]|nr:hypothetical protein [Planctomycetota bacterium]MBI3847058.1 hypothetical protein [Planctomycetota bacterium]